eukprot:171725-Amphidinium_carterae.1
MSTFESDYREVLWHRASAGKREKCLVQGYFESRSEAKCVHGPKEPREACPWIAKHQHHHHHHQPLAGTGPGMASANGADVGLGYFGPGIGHLLA